jgi:hypothetical protein
MDDDVTSLDEDIRALEALEASGPLISPARMSRKQRYRFWWGHGKAAKQEFARGVRRRDGHAPWVGVYNHLVAYGPDVTDRMVESGVGPFQVYAVWSQILDDLDLWTEATGERLTSRLLSPAEQLALESWLWEGCDRYDWSRRSDRCDRRRQDGRHKPRKSPDHDIPWPGANNWAPRRWLLGCVFEVPHNPLEISVSGAEKMEWKRALAESDLNIQHRLDQLDCWQIATGKTPEGISRRAAAVLERRGRPTNQTLGVMGCDERIV